jgi:hypothetical protein
VAEKRESRRTSWLAAAVLLVAGIAVAAQSTGKEVTRSLVDTTIAKWTAEPAKAARTIVSKQVIDKDEANILAINLANEVATGKRGVDDAGRFYAESVARMMKDGTPTDYMQRFQFIVASGNQGDPDKSVGPVGTTGRKDEGDER